MFTRALRTSNLIIHSLGVPTLAHRMSSTVATKQKHEWIVILPDNVGVLSKRMEVRPDHLEALTRSVESGFWKLGGAMLEEIPGEGEGPKIRGSVMLALANSREEVLKALQDDIYYKSGVWDWDQLQIHPFRSAFRQAL
ncbi:hypothetical protein N7G274_010918 [Stereocaulon virgatum]|uniref:YCII-related domain-containing protein n=1 Tax=Stereocaulon virgatum TaxID=373712 RepID=A0ABR3ZV46_9LECA